MPSSTQTLNCSWKITTPLSAATTGSTFAMIAFFVFEIIVTIAAVRLVNRLSREDAPMPGTFPEPTVPPFDSNQINRWVP